MNYDLSSLLAPGCNGAASPCFSPPSPSLAFTAGSWRGFKLQPQISVQPLAGAALDMDFLFSNNWVRIYAALLMNFWTIRMTEKIADWLGAMRKWRVSSYQVRCSCTFSNVGGNSGVCHMQTTWISITIYMCEMIVDQQY